MKDIYWPSGENWSRSNTVTHRTSCSKSFMKNWQLEFHLGFSVSWTKRREKEKHHNKWSSFYPGFSGELFSEIAKHMLLNRGCKTSPRGLRSSLIFSPTRLGSQVKHCLLGRTEISTGWGPSRAGSAHPWSKSFVQMVLKLNTSYL